MYFFIGHCYERIKKETEVIRKQADVQFGHGPEDKGITVLYESDKERSAGRGKEDSNIIIEIEKPRPNFFSGNLLQRSTLRSNPDAKSITPQAAVPVVAKDS